MVRHEKGPHQLDELLQRPKSIENTWSSYSPDRLHPSVIAFLNAVILSKYDEGMCYFVGQLEVRSADEVSQIMIITWETLTVSLLLMVLIRSWGLKAWAWFMTKITIVQQFNCSLGARTVYLDPVDDHEELWMLLETILSN